jgi:hypothetical protein
LNNKIKIPHATEIQPPRTLNTIVKFFPNNFSFVLAGSAHFEEYKIKLCPKRNIVRWSVEENTDRGAEKMEYKPAIPYLFLNQKRKLKLVAKIKKSITKFDITNEEPGIVTN